MTAPRVILASASPQRRDLLSRIGVTFEAAPTGVEELTTGVPEEVVLANALLKARAASREGAITIGCDTDVVVEGLLIGKPDEEARAHEFIAQLSGRRHLVLSGLAVLGPDPDEVRTEVVETGVVFRDLAPDEVSAYVATGEWRGRAGGYAVQGLGSGLVERIEGDLSNVIGLPLPALARLAPDLGLPV